MRRPSSLGIRIDRGRVIEFQAGAAVHSRSQSSMELHGFLESVSNSSRGAEITARDRHSGPSATVAIEAGRICGAGRGGGPK